jgi:dTDP-4-dehydrorhamnose reductase
MSILVLGSNGQLGKCLIDHYSNEDVLFLKKKDLDILDETKLAKIIKNYRPKFVINCSAYTKVEMAEIEHETAELINSHAVSNISELCKQTNSILIHISTDYVFDGKLKRPFTEEDDTNPLNIYGKTKLQGEESIIKSGARYIIIRTSWVYSEYGNNFLKTMLRLGEKNEELQVINDQLGCPTYAQDIAIAIKNIIESSEFDHIDNGIYHFCGDTCCSWYEFACKIFEICNKKGLASPKSLKPINAVDFETQVIRADYSVLDCSKYVSKFKKPLSSMNKGIEKSINQIKKNRTKND